MIYVAGNFNCCQVTRPALDGHRSAHSPVGRVGVSRERSRLGQSNTITMPHSFATCEHTGAYLLS